MASAAEQARRPPKPSQGILGALISTAASALKGSPYSTASGERAAQGYESTPEDAYTRALLFPDPGQMGHPSGVPDPIRRESLRSAPVVTGPSDGKARVDVPGPKDVRIIVAQDSSGSQPKAVLFDSKVVAAAAAAASASDRRSHPRRPDPQRVERSTSVAQSQAHRALAQAQGHGAMSGSSDGSGGGSGGMLDRSRRPALNSVFAVEPPQRLYGGEPVGEMRLLLDCMFGTTPLSYRGDTTKLHVFPNDETTSSRSATTSPIARENSGSWGRAEGRRRSHLSHSFTPGDLGGGADLTNGTSSNAVAVKESETRTLLLTRTFSVNLPDLAEPVTGDKERWSSTDGASAKQTSIKCPRRCKTPMYAVAITLQIPAAVCPTTARPRPIGGSSDHTHLDAQADQDAKLSPVEVDAQTGSLLLEAACAVNLSPFARVSGSDVDDHVDVVMQRFDMVSRVLSSLQANVRTTIETLLQESAVNTLHSLPPRLPVPARSVDEHGKAASDRAPTKSRKVILVQLSPGVLVADESIKQEAERASARLIAGLHIPMVVTGQGRWGLWRDEARWAEQCVGRKEQNFFFPRLLTAFLGNHPEWLYTLGLNHYRRRRPHQHGTARAAEDLATLGRTIIVGDHKPTARRLIYLLSAFLPAVGASASAAPSGRGGKPSSSGSSTPLVPQSVVSAGVRPPRRTPNQGTSDPQAESGPDHIGKEQRRSLVLENEDLGAGLSQPRSVWKPADSLSPMVASLPIPTGNAGTRKGSATTIATVTPTTTAPQLSSASVVLAPASARETGSGRADSLASINLIHTLKRNDSTENSHASSESQPGSRWGSLVSSFWSNRRASSTDETDISLPQEDSGAPSPKGGRPGRDVRGSRLAQMVTEVEMPSPTSDPGQDPRHNFEHASGSFRAKHLQEPLHDLEGAPDSPHPKLLPEPRYPDSPLKLSVDEKDGVVDVDFQLPSFLSSSFGSSARSPSTSGFTSAASFEDGSSGQGVPSAGVFPDPEPEPSINVAGWLHRYHPDFALQAVHPYPELIDDIKRSMREEPTAPRAVASEADQLHQEWLTVSTTLIADAETFTVKRLRLLRRAKSRSDAKLLGDASSDQVDPAVSSEAGQSSLDVPLPSSNFDEHFAEEPVFDIDSTLIDAVEHVTSTTVASGSTRSIAVGPSVSRQRDPVKRAAGAADPKDLVPADQCERTIREALEQVIRDLIQQVNADGSGRSASKGPNVAEQGEVVAPSLHVPESSLRDGIRKWVSEGEVWS